MLREISYDSGRMDPLESFIEELFVYAMVMDDCKTAGLKLLSQFLGEIVPLIGVAG